MCGRLIRTSHFTRWPLRRYVGEDTTPTNPALMESVRDLKTGAVVVQGRAAVAATATRTSTSALVPAGKFEIAVAHTSRGSTWQRISGRASTRRIRVDTLGEEPIGTGEIRIAIPEAHCGDDRVSRCEVGARRASRIWRLQGRARRAHATQILAHMGDL